MNASSPRPESRPRRPSILAGRSLAGLAIAALCGLVVQGGSGDVLHGQQATDFPACTLEQQAEADHIDKFQLGVRVRRSNEPPLGDVGPAQRLWGFRFLRNWWRPYAAGAPRVTVCGGRYKVDFFSSPFTEPERDWNHFIKIDDGSPFLPRLALGGGKEPEDCSEKDEPDDRCIEAEVTPPRLLADSLEENRPTSEVDQVCAYGPWVEDRGHPVWKLGGKPEIHPSESVWWRADVGDGVSRIGLLHMQDASERFDTEDDYSRFLRSFDGKPWAEGPIQSDADVLLLWDRRGSPRPELVVRERIAERLRVPDQRAFPLDDPSTNRSAYPATEPAVVVTEEVDWDENLGVSFHGFCERRDGRTQGYVRISTDLGGVTESGGFVYLEVFLGGPTTQLVANTPGIEEGGARPQQLGRIVASTIRAESGPGGLRLVGDVLSETRFTTPAPEVPGDSLAPPPFAPELSVDAVRISPEQRFSADSSQYRLQYRSVPLMGGPWVEGPGLQLKGPGEESSEIPPQAGLFSLAAVDSIVTGEAPASEAEADEWLATGGEAAFDLQGLGEVYPIAEVRGFLLAGYGPLRADGSVAIEDGGTVPDRLNEVLGIGDGEKLREVFSESEPLRLEASLGRAEGADRPGWLADTRVELSNRTPSSADFLVLLPGTQGPADFRLAVSATDPFGGAEEANLTLSTHVLRLRAPYSSPAELELALITRVLPQIAASRSQPEWDVPDSLDPLTVSVQRLRAAARYLGQDGLLDAEEVRALADLIGEVRSQVVR